MATIPPLRLSRAQLAQFLRDQEQIRAFENLFRVVEPLADGSSSSEFVEIGLAQASANEALSTIASVAQEAAVCCAVTQAKAQEALDRTATLEQELPIAVAMAENKANQALSSLTAAASLTGGNSFRGAQTVAFVALVDAATIDTDAALSNHFRVTLGGNRTLSNPTNMRDGGIYNWRVRQPAAGGPWVISSYGSLFRWNAGVPVYPAGANAVLRITGQYVGSDNVIECTWTSGWVV